MSTEMTDNYDEVTTLMAWRMAMLTVGVLVSGALTPMLVNKLGGGGRAGYAIMAMVIASLLAAAMIGTFFATGRAPQRKRLSKSPPFWSTITMIPVTDHPAKQPNQPVPHHHDPTIELFPDVPLLSLHPPNPPSPPPRIFAKVPPMRALRPLVLAGFVLTTIACDDDSKARITELETELEQAKQPAEPASPPKADAEEGDLAAAKAKIETLEAEIEAQAEKIDDLEGDKGTLEGELGKKEAALEAVKTLQDALSKSLVAEIETGEIRVSQRNGLLVVDVSDKVLFAIGEAELSERGQEVLAQLAESLKSLPNEAVFQVGGHTDNQPIKSEEVKAKFPTNWELSAARATNVVRFLEETAKIPGKRLVAAGFSQFRPVTGNGKASGRAKNRRIEIALLPRHK